MTRTLDNIVEVGFYADNGKHIRTQTTLEATTSLIRSYKVDKFGKEQPGEGYTATMSLRSPRTDAIVAVFDLHFTTIEEFLEQFGIEDDDEVFELLE